MIAQEKQSSKIHKNHNGHFEIVKHLYENRTEGCTTNEMEKCGHFKVVKYREENRTEGYTKDSIDNKL
ncbi:hypothetical protein THRCLA_21781 [Thraustotheca clavata]|uniref:Uncharacterized protein n=1 Tax=Thraustotheca clavata TaxID=74557 RepID=A0A1V9ZPW5_9STRA|nr:hypothetical protein THRCLA_21781 [Thraustotheca clavata]